MDELPAKPAGVTTVVLEAPESVVAALATIEPVTDAPDSAPLNVPVVELTPPDSVVAPVTPSVEFSVAAPVTPNVELNVVAPLTPNVPPTIALPPMVVPPLDDPLSIATAPEDKATVNGL